MAVKLSPKVKEVLTEVVAIMEKRPDLIEMDSWLGNFDKNMGASFCGTTGCIAGYVNTYYGFSKKFQVDAEYSGWGTFADYADNCPNALRKTKRELLAELNKKVPYGIGTPGSLAIALLGFERGEEETLFYREDWPEPFKSQYAAIADREDAYYETFSKKERTELGKITIARLKHFIETGE